METEMTDREKLIKLLSSLPCDWVACCASKEDFVALLESFIQPEPNPE